MRSPLPLALLLATLGMSTPARAGEATARHAPRPDAAFRFEGEMWWGGTRHGTVTFEARPQIDESVTTWHVRDVVTPAAPGADRVKSEAVLDAQLTTQRGTYDRRNPQGFLEGKYTRDARGQMHLEHRTAEYVNRTQPKGTTPAVTTLAAWILRCRDLDPSTGPWHDTDFDPDPPTGDPIRAPAILRHHGTGRWRLGTSTREARIWSLTRGARTWRLAFDPTSRAFLGLTVVGFSVSVAPKGTGPAGLAPPFDARLAAPVEVAETQARTTRRALPSPRVPLQFDGALTLDGEVIGRVFVDARPSSHRGVPCWQVSEGTERRGGEAVVRSESTLLLHTDLAVVRGETLYRAPSGWSRWTYEQTPSGMSIAHTENGTRRDAVVVPTRPRAVQGVAAVLLFLRQVPASPAQYVLPGFNPRFAGAPKAGSGALVSNAADITIHVVASADPAQLRARVQGRTGRRYEVVLDRASRDLVRIEGGLPRAHWVRDTQARKADWFAPTEQPPASARQAFVLFGRGYHLARRDWLKRAFHWPSMVEHAITQKLHRPGDPVERLQKAWIAEFIKRSKHRTTGDCDDLLMQIFLTMQVRPHHDGSVSFVSLPVYGGHTYKLREIDGRWWVVQID